WAIYGRAKEMRDAGIDVVMLSVGDHDHRTPDLILDAMYQSAQSGRTGYAPLVGYPALRAAIAERVMARSQVATDAQNIAVTPGGQFALYTALTTVVDPGDAVVMLAPYYATYPLTLRAVGAEARVVRCHPEAGFQPDLGAIAQAAQGARALLINSPNNPTGAVYSRSAMEGLARIAQEHDLWLISDEVYDTQIWEGEHVTPRSLPGMAERTLVIGSLSKSHRMTGSRLGWLIAPQAAANAASELSLATTFGVPGFIQDAALTALRDGADVEADVVATYARRRDLALAALTGANRVRVSPPQGAMYVMLDIRATGLSAHQFATRLLDEHHIAVMPTEGFGPGGEGHLRVALTVEDGALADALGTLRRFADAL
ncbi:MAG: aminotransferase class I/II-fold pyridoxal phosphate-dependent enzyme, partial [Pseudomonadota bacterium]